MKFKGDFHKAAKFYLSFYKNIVLTKVTYLPPHHHTTFQDPKRSVANAGTTSHFDYVVSTDIKKPEIMAVEKKPMARSS